MKSLKSLSEKVVNFQARLILMAVYFCILPIFVFLGRYRSKDSPAWKNWEIKSDDLEDLKKQW